MRRVELDLAVGGTLALVSFVAYAALAPSALQGADSSEFAMLAAHSGVAHPSGYPLYSLVARGFGWLPLGTFTHRASLATAVCGALAAGALYAACRAWGAERVGASFAALAYALSPRVWTFASVPEVFALNALAGACLAWVAAPLPSLPPMRRALWLGLVSGLGLSNHLSVVLLGPIGVLALARTLAPRGARHVSSAALAGGLVAGLTPYASVVWNARHASAEDWVWGRPDTLAGLAHHALRLEYGIGKLSPSPTGAQPEVHLPRLATTLSADLLYAPVLLAVVGIWSLWRRDRASAIALASAVILAGPVFVSRFNLPDNPIGHYLAARFYLLPEMLVCFGAAFGVSWILARVGSARVVAIAGTLFVCVLGSLSLPRVRAQHRDLLEAYLRETLERAPQSAVLIGTSDARLFGFEYLRRVEKVRPDVLYLSASLLNVAWYRDQVRALTGVELGPPRDYAEVALAFLREGRPVALTNYESIFDEVVEQFPNYPSGSTIRILTPGSPLPPLREIERETDALARASRIAPGTPVTRSEPWTAVAVNAYALPWNALAFDYHAVGDDASAQRCQARAAEYPLP